MFRPIRQPVTSLLALVLIAPVLASASAPAQAGADELSSPAASHHAGTDRNLDKQRDATTDAHIVWDAQSRGTKLMAARPDGTDSKVLFQQPRRDAYNLVVSPDNLRVAFDPGTRRGRSARLVVANIATGELRDLLPRRSEVLLVGPIGWSANGRRIVFQGYVDERARGSFYPSYLFSVASTGANLRKGRKLTDGSDNGAVFGSMLARGGSIVVPLKDTIVRYPSLRAGSGTVIARRAYDVRPTGNGKWLFFRHVNTSGRQSLKKIRANGREQRTVHRYRRDLQDLFLSYAPDTTGQYLLAVRVDPATQVGYQTVILNTETRTTVDLAFARGTANVAW